MGCRALALVEGGGEEERVVLQKCYRKRNVTECIRQYGEEESGCVQPMLHQLSGGYDDLYIYTTTLITFLVFTFFVNNKQQVTSRLPPTKGCQRHLRLSASFTKKAC